MSKRKCDLSDESEPDENVDEVDTDDTDHDDCESSFKILNNFSPVVHEFEGRSKVSFTAELSEKHDESDYFTMFLNEECLQQIVRITNRHYEKIISNKNVKIKSRLRTWTTLTVHELYVFIALTMLMTRNRHLHLSEYWSTDPLLSNTTFGKSMSRNRYMVILLMLTFESEKSPDDTKNDPSEFFSFIDHIKKQFKTMLSPCENLRIDDKNVKGHNKNNKNDIDTFLLADVETGFIIDFIIDMRRSKSGLTSDRKLGLHSSYVCNLLQDYVGKGHKVWMGEQLTSPKLFNFLHENKLNVCGCTRQNSKGMLCFHKLEDGEVEVKRNGPTLIIKWHNRRDYYMLTTMHEATMIDSNDEITGKPRAYVEYKEFMKAPDIPDIMINTLNCLYLQKSKRAAFNVIDLILLNSYIAYKSVTKIDVTLDNYHLSVIRQLISKYLSTASKYIRLTIKSDTPLRLSVKDSIKHMPNLIPSSDNIKSLRRRCRVCSQSTIKPRKRRSTQYMCYECDVPLCVFPCFSEYHKLEKY